MHVKYTYKCVFAYIVCVYRDVCLYQHERTAVLGRFRLDIRRKKG